MMKQPDWGQLSQFHWPTGDALFLSYNRHRQLENWSHVSVEI